VSVERPPQPFLIHKRHPVWCSSYVSVQGEIQVGKELACERGSEVVPGRAIGYDGLNGQEQKTEDSERRRKRMTRPARKQSPATANKKNSANPPRTVKADDSPK
jgi:hypothetical protein